MSARKVREVMTSPVTVGTDTDLVTVARRMRDEGIGSVLVVDGDRLRGLVSDRDLVVRGLAAEADARTAKVGDIASEAIVTVGPDDELDKAAEVMRERSVRRLPVVQDGNLVGIVSIGDLAIEKDERSALADISAAKPNR